LGCHIRDIGSGELLPKHLQLAAHGERRREQVLDQAERTIQLRREPLDSAIRKLGQRNEWIPGRGEANLQLL